MKHDSDVNRFSEHAATHIQWQTSICVCAFYVNFYEKNGMIKYQQQHRPRRHIANNASKKKYNKAAVLYAFTHDERVWRHFTRMQLTLCTCSSMYYCCSLWLWTHWLLLSPVVDSLKKKNTTTNTEEQRVKSVRKIMPENEQFHWICVWQCGDVGSIHSVEMAAVIKNRPIRFVRARLQFRCKTMAIKHRCWRGFNCLSCDMCDCMCICACRLSIYFIVFFMHFANGFLYGY